jgi:hypothetical protein
MNKNIYENNQTSISIKTKNIIKSFDIFKQYLIIGTEKGFFEIFDYIKELSLGEYNLFYKEKSNINIKNFSFSDLINPNVNLYSLQIINIKVNKYLSKNLNDIFFFAQSRKGDIFLINFIKENKIVKNLLHFEIHNETFCKFLFFEEKINKNNDNCNINSNNFNENQNSFFINIFTPSDKENLINLFELKFEDFEKYEEIKIDNKIYDMNSDSKFFILFIEFQ